MMLLGLGIARVSEIVGAFGERKCSGDFADCDADGFGRARGGLAVLATLIAQADEVIE
jgi:hypothetical protein